MIKQTITWTTLSNHIGIRQNTEERVIGEGGTWNELSVESVLQWKKQ